jgi:hypothetical protein
LNLSTTAYGVLRVHEVEEKQLDNDFDPHKNKKYVICMILYKKQKAPYSMICSFHNPTYYWYDWATLTWFICYIPLIQIFHHQQQSSSIPFVHIVDATELLSSSSSSIFFKKNQALQQQPNHQERRSVANIIGGKPISILNKTLYEPYAIPTDQRMFCGAVLIWDDVLLSAGHCEGGFNFSKQSIMIGSTVLDGSDAIEKNISIRTTMVHPNYKIASDENAVENDIMLIFLNRTTNSNIPLAKINFDPLLPRDYAPVSVIGYGINNQTIDELSNHLNILNMNIIDFYTCNDAYDVLNEEEHLCATGTKTAIAPCSGDSGGPLYYMNGTTNSPTVVGIVSFGYCYYQRFTPSTVFTRISSYNDWILSTICEHSIHPPTLDMCNGIVPLERIPQPPSMVPISSPTASPSILPNPLIKNEENCSISSNNQCKYLIFFTGVYVHQSFLGICRSRCVIFPTFATWMGGKCGTC